jgi:hypothetical protein
VRLENPTYIKIYVALISVLQVYVIIKFLLTLVGIDFVVRDLQGIDIYTKLIIGATVTATTAIIGVDFYFAIKCMQGFGNGLREALIDSHQNSIN